MLLLENTPDHVQKIILCVEIRAMGMPGLGHSADSRSLEGLHPSIPNELQHGHLVGRLFLD